MTSRIATLEAALAEAVMDYSGEHSWCRLCRTRLFYTSPLSAGVPRPSHPHADHCALAPGDDGPEAPPKWWARAARILRAVLKHGGLPAWHRERIGSALALLEEPTPATEDNDYDPRKYAPIAVVNKLTADLAAAMRARLDAERDLERAERTIDEAHKEARGLHQMLYEYEQETTKNDARFATLMVHNDEVMSTLRPPKRSGE